MSRAANDSLVSSRQVFKTPGQDQLYVLPALRPGDVEYTEFSTAKRLFLSVADYLAVFRCDLKASHIAAFMALVDIEISAIGP